MKEKKWNLIKNLFYYVNEVYKDSFVDKDEFDFENIISSNEMNCIASIYHISKILLLEQDQNI